MSAPASRRPRPARPAASPKAEDGVSAAWTPEFPGQRPPFQAGHELSVRHGAYAVVLLGPRVEELADELRPVVPVFAAADEVALRLLALTLSRLERAEEALAAVEPGEAGRLRQDALGWANSARRLLNDLGMTPTSRAGLGLDLSRAAAVRETVLAGFDGDGKRLRLAAEGSPEGRE